MKNCTRRDFLQNTAMGGILGAWSLSGCISSLSAKPRAVPTKEQLIWAEQELGMFFHFDIPVFKPGWKWRTYADYPDPSLYNPAQLDTDQWMEAAKAMGAKYVVFVAKHCSGFLQWQSDLYGYGLKQSPWRGGKGDVVGDFVASARRYGLKPGLYASVSANAWLEVDNPGLVNRGKGGDDEAQRRYARICEGMARELWSRYGDLFEIWFDGGALSPERGGPDLMPILLKYQPQAILFQGPASAANRIRWVGNERGVAPYPCWGSAWEGTQSGGTAESRFPGDPDAPIWIPGECDVPLRNHAWFWGENEGKWRYWSDEELLSKYYSSVGRNCNLLLNANPAPNGLIDERDMEQYRRFGRMIRERFDNPLARTSGRGERLTIDLPAVTPVDQVVLMEDVSEGHRIRSFVIEGEAAEGGWKTLLSGSCVGHKYIGRIGATAVRRLRFASSDSRGEPVLREFSAYSTGLKGPAVTH